MEIEEKLKELREKRNNLSAEISKCQEEIDKLELEKYDTQRFLGKILDLSGYIRIRSSECWLYVTSIERLIDGPRFHGTMIRVGKDMTGKITFVEVSVDSSVTKKWEELEKLKIEESPRKVINYFHESLKIIDLEGILVKNSSHGT